MSVNEQARYNPLLHGFAVLAAFFTFLLLGLGGLVTSHGTTPAANLSYNAHRIQLDAVHPITAFQVVLQMVHRLVALGISVLIALSAWQAWRRLGRKDALAKPAMFWLGLIVLQICLGAATIWTNKAADVATAHVLGGALALVVGALWCAVAFGRSREALEMKPATISGPFGTSPAMAASK